MKSPMYNVATRGTATQQYLGLARMFRQAAIDLPAYVNGQVNWPRYALISHAIELVLKAFAHFFDHDPSTGARAANHYLVGWYNIALRYGLPENETIAQHIDVLNVLHQRHYMRYPSDQQLNVPSIANISDDAVDYLVDQLTHLMNRR